MIDRGKAMTVGAAVVGIACVILLVVVTWVQPGKPSGGVSRYTPVKSSSQALNRQDMEIIVNRLVNPAMRRNIASSPASRAEFVNEVRTIFSLAEAARREGFEGLTGSEAAQQVPGRQQVETLLKKVSLSLAGPTGDGLNSSASPVGGSALRTKIEFYADRELAEAYTGEHPGLKLSREQIESFFDRNPGLYDRMVKAVPELATSVVFQDSGRVQVEYHTTDKIREIIASARLFAERARNEGFRPGDQSRVKIRLLESLSIAEEYRSWLRSKILKDITPQEVERYFASHSEDFEQVRARHILIRNGAGPEEIRSKAQSILDRAKKGEDFAQLAREYSEDYSTKATGGDLGLQSRRQIMTKLSISFSLKPGEISSLIESPQGYNILKLEEATPPVLSQEIRQQITDLVCNSKLEEKIKEIVETNGVTVAEDFAVTT